MTLQVDGVKWKIKFDSDEKAYILYRIMSKDEMQSHLDSANAELANIQGVITNFNTYITDERVVEPKP